MPGYLVVAIVICCALLLVLFVYNLLVKRYRAVRERLQEKYPNPLFVEFSANYMGSTDQSLMSLRGNGILVFDQNEMHFEMLAPTRTITIPYEAITGISTPRVFMGRSKLGKNLVVEYVGKNGEQVKSGWIVCNLDKAVELLGEKKAS